MALNWKNVAKYWKVSNVEHGAEMDLQNGDVLVFYEITQGKRRIARFRPSSSGAVQVEAEWATVESFAKGKVKGTHKSRSEVTIGPRLGTSGTSAGHQGKMSIGHGPVTHQGTWHGDGG